MKWVIEELVYQKKLPKMNHERIKDFHWWCFGNLSKHDTWECFTAWNKLHGNLKTYKEYVTFDIYKALPEMYVFYEESVNAAIEEEEEYDYDSELDDD